MFHFTFLLNKIFLTCPKISPLRANGKSAKGYGDNVENLYVTARQLNAQVGDSVSLVSQHKLDIRKITAERPFVFRNIAP